MELKLRGLVEVFRPGESILYAEKLSGGHINQTIRVDLPSGKWVFQEINKAIFPDPDALMYNFKLIQLALGQSNFDYLIPDFQPWAGGGVIHWSPGGRAWRVMPFWEHWSVREKASSREDVAQAGQAFGALCRYLDAVNPKEFKTVIPRFFEVNFRWNQLEEAWRKGPSNRKSFAEAEMNRLKQGKAHYTKEIEVPTRIIHGDGKMSNLLFDGAGQLKAVLDWDTAMPGTILDEFGYLARSIISRKAEDDADDSTPFLNREYLLVLLEAFVSSAGDSLSGVEKNSLLFGLKRTLWVQSVRFLADYLSGDTYFPAKRLHHNLDRAKNQLFLLVELEDL